MIVVTCLNKNGVRFDKEFASPYVANKFIRKVKRGKELKIVAIFKD